ncbi:hypothetical protein HYFRA_00008401 [Hymenoscyphus fraxineus]|uniref:Uncharacterized protein n=1 Tax=Hymenoscyphus fraxineus TaxID=746836 RepID=A0A9N9PFB5_9HELO|nr:hypothetical protein HYFRA_00008401 [Hymenoscyphus fraxineus]
MPEKQSKINSSKGDIGKLPKAPSNSSNKTSNPNPQTSEKQTHVQPSMCRYYILDTTLKHTTLEQAFGKLLLYNSREKCASDCCNDGNINKKGLLEAWARGELGRFNKLITSHGKPLASREKCPYGDDEATLGGSFYCFLLSFPKEDEEEAKCVGCHKAYKYLLPVPRRKASEGNSRPDSIAVPAVNNMRLAKSRLVYQKYKVKEILGAFERGWEELTTCGTDWREFIYSTIWLGPRVEE